MVHVALGVVLGVVAGVAPAANPPRIEIDFCQMPLAQWSKDAYLSFNVFSSFTVDGNGVPQRIEVFSSPGISGLFDFSAPVECISKWRFPGIEEGTKFFASFRWEHGTGWTEMGISSPVFSQTIRLSGERCPYCTETSPGFRRSSPRARSGGGEEPGPH